jgi:hypothetical protein
MSDNTNGLVDQLDCVVHERNEIAEKCVRYREALEEIAKADTCSECSWTKLEPNGYRNTCCMEVEKDPSRWCVTCVAAHALGWDTDRLVRECAGPEYVEGPLE